MINPATTATIDEKSKARERLVGRLLGLETTSATTNADPHISAAATSKKISN